MKSGHVSSQCTSGLPAKVVEEEEDVVNMMLQAVPASAPSRFEHDTTFRVLEDGDSSSEDGDSGSEDLRSLAPPSENGDEDDRADVGDASLSDYLASGAIWMDEADEDMIRASDPSSPCCMFTCTSRGRQCLSDLLWTIRDSWPENPAWLQPLPGIATQEETHSSPPPALECEPPPASECETLVQSRHSAKKAKRRMRFSVQTTTTTCQHDHCSAPGLCRSLVPGLRQADDTLEGELRDEVMEWDASASLQVLLSSKLPPATSAHTTAPLESQAETWERIDDDIVGVRNVGVQTEENFNTDEGNNPWEEVHEDVFYDCDWASAEDAEAHVLEGEAFDELNVADGSVDNTIQIALDSGAGEHVASRSIAPKYSVVESAGSKAGQHFVAAGGARIANEGQFKLRLRSGGPAQGEGKDIESTFQVAKVTRPLWSVGRICDEGFSINFTQTEAVVQNKLGKAVCKFHRKGGL